LNPLCLRHLPKWGRKKEGVEKEEGMNINESKELIK
jgi:hypothetical protein